MPRNDCLWDILPGEEPGLHVEGADSLHQPLVDMGLALTQQMKLVVFLGAWSLALEQRGLGLLFPHLQKALMVSCHHALICSLHPLYPTNLCQKMPPKTKLFASSTCNILNTLEAQ